MVSLENYYRNEVEKEHMRQMQERKEKVPEWDILKEQMKADRNVRAAEHRGSVATKRPNRRAKRSAKVAEILEAVRRDCYDYHIKEVEREHRRWMQEHKGKDYDGETLKERIETDHQDKAAEGPAIEEAQGVCAFSLEPVDGRPGFLARDLPAACRPAPIQKPRTRLNRSAKKRAQFASDAPSAPAKKIEANVVAEAEEEEEGDVDESGIVPLDIELVMSQFPCSRGKAVTALRANNYDVVDALAALMLPVAPTKQLVLGVGARVRLEGLNAAAFNGRTGTLTAFDEAKERWAVTLEGGTGHETKLFKASNVVVIQNAKKVAPSASAAQAAPAKKSKPGASDTDYCSISETEDEGEYLRCDVDVSGIKLQDIKDVMMVSSCSRADVVAALRANNLDIVQAYESLLARGCS
jgi:NACalpha-BTF3-like transcription factor